MNENNEPRTTDRRKQADILVKGATTLSVVSWLVSIASVLALEIASPASETLVDHMRGITPDTMWNTTILQISFFLLIFSLLSCVCAFIFNMLRMRRKTDKYRKSIIIIGLVNTAGFAAFMLVFGGQMF